MVVLAASICTRGGKAVLSRQFRDMQRSRVEALLASLPKLADSGSQHTTAEQDNVRYVYQPLDELYMVLITNRQSNILQDIDSLHLFAQVVTSLCRTLDEREITRNAFELLSAFDELVTLGYRENLTLSQIKTFLDMQSHEENVANIIENNKRLEADDIRKRKAKEIEMKRKDLGRGLSRQQSYQAPPIYQAPVTDVRDTYAAERNKATKSAAPVKKGWTPKAKSGKTAFDQVRGELGPEEDTSAPLVPTAPAAQTAPKPVSSSTSSGREPIHIVLGETISAKLSREGTLESFEVKGDLKLQITDASLAQIKLNLSSDSKTGVQYHTHPAVDKSVFTNSKILQLKDTSKGFPSNNNPVQVMRWRYAAKPEEVSDIPLTLTAWVNQGSDDTYSITVEYELTGSDSLKDVVITIPYATNEPAVSSFDAVYEVSGDSLDWTIGAIDSDSPNGSFEFEAQADSEGAFFPMTVAFAKTVPFVDVDVSSVTLVSMGQGVPFSKDVRSIAEKYIVV